MTTELEILNAMLAVNGETGVQSVSSSDPSAIQARAALKIVNRKIQKVGRWYNREDMTLTQNSSGEIVLPSNTLSVDPVSRRSPYIQRGTRLYDRKNNTFIINESVDCVIVLQLPVEELPEAVSMYLLDRAVLDYYVDEDGDAQKVQKLEQRLNSSFAEYQKQNLSNEDVSIHTSPLGAQLLSESQPRYRTRRF